MVEPKTKPIQQNQVFLIGGAHSVGKSTVIEVLRTMNNGDEIGINIISMSNMLNQIAREQYSKSIVELNQDAEQRQKLQYETMRFLRTLNFPVTLLDGHYVNTNPDKTFSPNYNINKKYTISFDALVVLTAKPEAILSRRIEKKQTWWSLDVRHIENEQNLELSEAKRIGDELKVPIRIIENVDMRKAAERIRELLNVPRVI